MSAFDTPNVNKRTLDRFEAAVSATRDSFIPSLVHQQHNRSLKTTKKESSRLLATPQAGELHPTKSKRSPPRLRVSPVPKASIAVRMPSTPAVGYQGTPRLSSGRRYNEIDSCKPSQEFSDSGNRSTITVNIRPSDSASAVGLDSRFGRRTTQPSEGVPPILHQTIWDKRTDPRFDERDTAWTGADGSATTCDYTAGALAGGTHITRPLPVASARRWTMRTPVEPLQGDQANRNQTTSSPYKQSYVLEDSFLPDHICRCGETAAVPSVAPYAREPINEAGRAADAFQGQAPVAHYTHPALEQLARTSPTSCGARVTSTDAPGDCQGYACQCKPARANFSKYYQHHHCHELARKPPGQFGSSGPCRQPYHHWLEHHDSSQCNAHPCSHTWAAPRQQTSACQANATQGCIAWGCCQPSEGTISCHLGRDACCHLDPPEFFSPSSHRESRHHHHHPYPVETHAPQEPAVHAPSPAPIIDIDVPYPVPV